MIWYNMKCKLVIGICVLILLVGCSSSEFVNCYNICRAKEYQKIDGDCDYTDSKYVREYCSIEEKNLIEIKDFCFNECKSINSGCQFPNNPKCYIAGARE